MSSHSIKPNPSARQANPLHQRLKRYGIGETLTPLAWCDATFASVAADAGVAMLLDGDSRGNVLQGKSSTLQVTTDNMPMASYVSEVRYQRFLRTAMHGY